MTHRAIREVLFLLALLMVAWQQGILTHDEQLYQAAALVPTIAILVAFAWFWIGGVEVWRRGNSNTKRDQSGFPIA